MKFKHSEAPAPGISIQRRLIGTAAGAMATALLATPSQGALVSACTGASLPTSAITQFLSPVVTGLATPIQTTVNNILDVAILGIDIGPLVVGGPLSIDTTGILNNAIAGGPITLDVLKTDGTILGPADSCQTTADSFTLDTPAGIAIGGNSITGLGGGAAASAGTIDSIAFGNGASTSLAATDSIALGARASATAANSIALGADSAATRGALAGYAAPGLAAAQTSAGEVSVGSPGAERQITNVAPGSQPTDAVNLAQVTGAISGASAAVALQYSDPGTPTTPNGGTPTNDVTLVGAAAAPVALHNVAPGVLAAGSTDAVNGGQLFDTNGNVATNTTNIATNTANIAGNTTSIAGNTTAITNINNGTTGIVRQAGGAPGTGTITVGAQTAGTLVDLTGTGGTRVLTGVTAGGLTALSTDAVNGSQLFATNANVTTNTTNIAGNTTAITSLTTNINNGSTGLVQQDGGAPGNGVIRIGQATGGTSISVAGTAGDRIISGVAAGVAATDAVNAGQLSGLGSSIATSLGGGSVYNPLTGQVTAGISYGGNSYNSVQGAVSAIETSIGGLTPGTNLRYFNANSVMADSQALGTDATAIGPNSVATADGSIAAGRNTSAGSAGSVAIGDGSTTTAGKSVAIGSANIASGDGAVAIGDPNIATGDGAVALGRDNQSTGTGAVTLGDTNLATGDASIGIGQNNSVVGTSAIAVGTGNTVNGDGAIAIGTGNQVAGTNSLAFGSNIVSSGTNALAVGNNTAATGDNAVAYGNGAAASGLRSAAFGTASVASATFSTAIGETASATGYASVALGTGANAANLGSTAIGAGASATVNDSVALGGASSATRGGQTGYTAFGLAATQSTIGEIAVARTIVFPDPVTGLPQLPGERQITGVGAGSEDTDAVNVAQLRGVSNTLGTAIVTGLGGGATYNIATGAVTGPTYVIGGNSYTNVGDALAGLGGTVTQAANAVTYDTATKDLVTLGGAAGTTITNVAAGAVTAASTDAVNGGQLFATQTGIGDIVTVVGGTYNTTTGAYTGPSYSTAGATTATTVQNAFNNYNTAIDNLTNGTAGLVQQAGAAAPITVGAATGGTSVDFTGTGGTRVLSGLSDGLVGSDAATVRQLASVVGGAFNAVQYDVVDGTRQNSITLVGGGAGAVTINNVADGSVAAGSTQAVNGGQLAATNAQVTNITNGTANAGAFRSDNTAGAAPSAATGANSAAGGFGASATGVRSVALGNGSTSSGTNSVALGAGSSDGGTPNVVSIGSAGAERRLTNVGPGLNGTDAVNLSQLQAATNSFTTTTNGLQGQINQLDYDLSKAKRRANAGTAGALAIAGLPQPFTEGAGMVGGGVGYWQGQVAFAVGVSKIVSEKVIVKAGASVSGRGSAGGNAGVGFQF